MKTVEKNGITFIYVDNDVVNNDRYNGNFCHEDESPDKWMMEATSTETTTYLMSKEEVYEMLMAAYERVAHHAYEYHEDPENDDSQVKWCAIALLS